MNTQKSDATRNGPATDKVRHGAYFALTLCCLAYITTTYLRNCPNILSQDLQDSFGVSGTQVSLLSASTLLAYGLIQLPSGIITDLLGGRKSLTLFTALAALATLGFALAPNMPAGVAARFVTGLALAAVPPACAVLASYFPASRYTFAIGILFSSGVIGTIMATEPLARSSQAFGWRPSLIFSAAFIAVLAALIWLRMKEVPAAKESAAGAGSAKSKARAIIPNIKQVLATRHFWHLALFHLGASAVIFSFYTQWGAPLLMQSFAMTKVEASRILLQANIIGMFLIPALGSLADRFSRRGVLILCACAGLSGFGALALFSGQLGPVALTVAVTTVSVAANTCASCIFALAQSNFPARLAGTAIGCLNALWPVLASGLNVLFGAVLEWRTSAIASAGQAFDAQQIAAQAFSQTLILYLAGWALSLAMGIFFVRNKFEVK